MFSVSNYEYHYNYRNCDGKTRAYLSADREGFYQVVTEWWPLHAYNVCDGEQAEPDAARFSIGV